VTAALMFKSYRPDCACTVGVLMQLGSGPCDMIKSAVQPGRAMLTAFD
jgi:hypothetical protein